jgi:hypothetical protein
MAKKEMQKKTILFKTLHFKIESLSSPVLSHTICSIWSLCIVLFPFYSGVIYTFRTHDFFWYDYFRCLISKKTFLSGKFFCIWFFITLSTARIKINLAGIRYKTNCGGGNKFSLQQP